MHTSRRGTGWRIPLYLPSIHSTTLCATTTKGLVLPAILALCKFDAGSVTDSDPRRTAHDLFPIQEAHHGQPRGHRPNL